MNYVACIAEGAAETAIIDILLDHHLLIFDREEMLDDIESKKKQHTFQKKSTYVPIGNDTHFNQNRHTFQSETDTRSNQKLTHVPTQKPTLVTITVPVFMNRGCLRGYQVAKMAF